MEERVLVGLLLGGLVQRALGEGRQGDARCVQGGELVESGLGQDAVRSGLLHHPALPAHGDRGVQPEVGGTGLQHGEDSGDGGGAALGGEGHQRAGAGALGGEPGGQPAAPFVEFAVADAGAGMAQGDGPGVGRHLLGEAFQQGRRGHR